MALRKKTQIHQPRSQCLNETYWTQLTRPFPCWHLDLFLLASNYCTFQWEPVKGKRPHSQAMCESSFHTGPHREFTMTIALDYSRATTEVRISVWLLSVQFCSSPAHPHSLSANTKTHVWFYPCGYSQISQGTHVPNHTQNSHFALVRPLDITWDSQKQRCDKDCFFSLSKLKRLVTIQELEDNVLRGGKGISEVPIPNHAFLGQMRKREIRPKQLSWM